MKTNIPLIDIGPLRITKLERTVDHRLVLRDGSWRKVIMTPKGYIFTTEEAQAKRVEFVETKLIPTLRKQGYLKEGTSAVMFVAQYWNDEANDAVHFRVSISKTSKTPKGFSRLPEFDRDDPAASLSEYDLRRDQKTGKIDYTDDSGFTWDSNGQAITLWCAFAEGGHTQDSEYSDAYRSAVTIESDGSYAFNTMVRPWLDGVMCDNEQYFLDNGNMV